MLLFLQEYSPAYNGSDPMFPRIEIDGAVLNDLPARDRGDLAGEVDWASFLNEASSVAPEVYRGVPGATIGTGADNEDPGSESGIGRAPEAEVDQGELLRRVLEHATTGAPIEWPRRGENVNEFTSVNYVAAAFPHLFWRGQCQLLAERLWKPAPNEWFAHLLRFKGGRFARDKRFRYFVHDTIARHRNANVARAFVRRQFSGRTLNEIREDIDNSRCRVGDALARFVNCVPGNRAYWKRQSNLLQSMDWFLQYSFDQTFTIFYTLSHADLHCRDLHHMLHKLDRSTTAGYLQDDGSPIPNLARSVDYRHRRNAVLHNPHVVAAHFAIRGDEFFKNVMTPHLNIVDYTRRIEMQGRGISHEHGLARCAHAPEIGDLLMTCEAVSKRHANDPIGVTPAERAAVSRVILWIQQNLPMTAMFPGPFNDDEQNECDDAVLRMSFSELSDDAVHDESSEAWRSDQRRLCLRCIMHKCSPDDCKKPRCNDCACLGDASVSCDKCRPPCKKGFDANDPCPRHRCESSDAKARIPAQVGANRAEFSACGCKEWVFWNGEGNRVEFHVPRDHSSLHVRVPVLLSAWRANMDLRFCLDIDCVKKYILKYAMKAEKMSRAYKDVMSELLQKGLRANNGEDPDATLIFSRFLNELCCERDFSAVEINHIGLGFPLVQSSRRTVWLNLSDDAMSPLAQPCDEERADEVEAGTVTTYGAYLARGPELENLRLYDLASRFDGDYNPITDPSSWRVPHVIPWRNPNKKKVEIDDYLLYCRDRLRLYVAHRNDDDLLAQSPDYDAALHTYVECNPDCPGVLRREVEYYDNRFEAAAGIDDQAEPEDDEDPVQRRDRIRRMRARMSEAGFGAPDDDASFATSGHPIAPPSHWATERDAIEAQLGTERLRDLRPGHWLDRVKDELGDDGDFERREVLPEHLNRDQRFLFNVLKQFDDDRRANSAAPPCRIIVPGYGGVGKSFTLDAFVHHLISTHGCKVGDEILICAYTGVAALLVGGTTAHRTFTLPIGTSFADLTDSTKIAELREKSCKAQWLFVDERSMLGLRVFGMMQKRMNQANDGPDFPFRNLHICMFGDNGQLPPVGDLPLYASSQSMNECVVAGRAAYATFDSCVPLTQNVRAAADPVHKNAMARLHDAETTLADWQLFKTRSLHSANANMTPVEKQLFLNDALYLFSSNAEANAHNEAKLATLGAPIAHFVAKSTGRDAAIRDHPWKGGGMFKDLYLGKGARVMLRRNMWISKGLVNGSLGRVISIVFERDEPNAGSGVLPVGVVCSFDKYTGPPFLADHPRSVFVPVVTAVYDENDDVYTRTQVPLIPAWAVTIHKSQGMTIGATSNIAQRCVIDIGNREVGSGMSYVAFSRAMTTRDYAVRFPIFTLQRITRIKTHEQFKSRVREDSRLRTMATATRARFASLVPPASYIPVPFP